MAGADEDEEKTASDGEDMAGDWTEDRTRIKERRSRRIAGVEDKKYMNIHERATGDGHKGGTNATERPPRSSATTINAEAVIQVVERVGGIHSELSLRCRSSHE